MTTTTVQLPIDLERLIFECTVRLYPDCFSSLVSVAWRVKAWLDPIRYHTLALHDKQRYDAFVAVLEHLPPSLIGKHVRNLSCKGLDAVQQLKILSICTQVDNLALWHSECHPSPLFLKAMKYDSTYSNLKRFTGDISIFSLPEFGTPMASLCFQQLTHLHVTTFGESWSRYNNWNLNFPNMTHLALQEDTMRVGWPRETSNSLRRILSSCQRLRVLVMFVGAEEYEVITLRTRRTFGDIRLVVRKYPRNVNRLWLNGACGKFDFWEEAEHICYKTTKN